MSENKIVGYKKIFGFVLPDWVDESLVRQFAMYLLVVVAMLFVLLLLIWPRFDKISELKSSLNTKLGELEALKKSKDSFDGLNGSISVVDQDLVLRAIPLVYSPEGSIFTLRKLAEEIPGLTIVSYSLPSGVLFEADSGVTENKDGDDSLVDFRSYPVELKVMAPVESLLLFIKKVESSLPFGVVSDVAMQEVSKMAKSVSTERSIQMDLEISYYQAALGRVNIAKVKPISDEEMSLIKVLSGYQSVNLGGYSEIPAAINTSGNLFGL